ncbi:head GIN domain-containing protein [Sediminicola luteus]|uniref:Chaperonin n=1 Tax=Sediminicola luteus TaxID=319238 RepID=A0A2A4GDC5_9FLAO|nr:head GIN domain-containing protein [Sediminicola luteus]PCE66597.1 chaperonin [Sediminicola luteus]
MKHILLVFALVLSTQLVAQSDKITQEIGAFAELKVFDGLSITLIPSDVNKVVITGDDAKKVSVINKDGNLKIRMDIDKIFSGHRTFVDLYYKQEINVLDVNEDARIATKAPIVQKVLEIKAQEGGECEIGADLEQLIIKAVTGGEVTVSGTATNQDININTGGRFLGKELATQITTVVVNAGGLAEINSTDYVKVTVKAGGNVKVYGNPDKMDEKTLFGGKITRM